MRVLGFSKKWPKLSMDEFTTFRFPRKDTDWQVGEIVQIVYHPRSNKDREIIGTAKIIIKQPYCLKPTGSYLYPTQEDAEADGFPDVDQFLDFFYESYGDRIFSEPMNKLTLEKL